MSGLDCHIKRENDKLRVAGVRVTILQRGNWLYLRAVLPPKHSTGKVKPHRQEYTPKPAGLPASTEGLKRAFKLARKLWNAVESGAFDWEVWSGKTPKSERSVKEWVAEFKPYWLDVGSRGQCSESSWKRHWQADFGKLPQEQALTPDILMARLLQIPQNTRQRKRACNHFQQLADFAKISIDLRPYQGEYSTGRSEVRRDLPSDDLIVEWWEKIPNPQWRWVYAVIACLGVRPHEAFFLEPTPNPLVWNVLDGKTGPRPSVGALKSKWAEMWLIASGHPPDLDYGRDFIRYGDRVGAQFRRYKLPFAPYDLRHAYAVRCLGVRISESVAAKMMGHSVAVHTKTYQRWLSAAEQEAMYMEAIKAEHSGS